MKIDGITHLSPRLDGASSGFASDLVSIGDKAAAELFGKLSKIDLIAFLTKTLSHWSAFVAQAPVKSKASACEDRRNPLQASKTHNPVARLKLNIASAPSVRSNLSLWVPKPPSRPQWASSPEPSPCNK
jgi:hypothetical protein